MGGLRKFVDKIKPTFSEGGKLSFLASTFDAFETFLFVPNTTTSRGAHIRDCNDMKRTMIVVVVALMPALLFGMYNTGYQVGMTGWAAFWFGFLKVLPMIVVSYVVGLGIEFFFAQKRGHEVNEGFLVSGLLIPMIMPVGTPLWMIALGTAFAVIFGKEVFGGTGMNVFNPALVARAFVFFAYTPFISGEKVWFADDAVSGATALEQLATSGAMSYSTADAFLGFIPGCVGETSTLAILIGAAILLFTGAASWRPGNGILFPGTRRDDLPRLGASDRRRFRFRRRAHGHRSRHVGPDPYGPVYRRVPHRCARRVDPCGQSGLSRRYDACDPLHERIGSASGLLRGRVQHLAPEETC